MSQHFTPREVAVSEPVTLINAFTVPLDESERFLQRWRDGVRVMTGQPGFIRARVHQSLTNDAELRFVNVAEWDSGNALARAQANPEWRASVQRTLGDPTLRITSRPAVYQVAVDVRPGDRL